MKIPQPSVPPPYVPHLGDAAMVFASPVGYQEQKAESVIGPSKIDRLDNWHEKTHIDKPSFTWPRWLQLSVRERVLVALLLISFAFVPAMLPRASVDAREFLPSNQNLQAVERAQDNFPGSAFYFIDPGYAIPQNYDELALDPLANPNSENGLSTNTGLTAQHDDTVSAHLIRPASFRGTISDNSRALQCLTSAIYYEAASEPDAGQRAVAQVILNRVRHPSYPNTVCGVVFQGSERRTGCQFSYTCDGSLRRTPSRFYWDRAKQVAILALGGRIASPVGTATHYHTTEIYPYWAPSLRFLGTIGAHRFYSWKGRAGLASAFSQRYNGGEPLPAPKPRAYNDTPASSLDPVTLEKAYEEGRRKAQEEAAKSETANALAADNARRHSTALPSLEISTPRNYQTPSYSKESLQKGGDKAYAGQKLPDISQIKPEYRNSGTWKQRPGS